jgi:hypothetical protein
MAVDADLFALSPNLQPRMELLGGRLPVLIVDNLYARPDDVRAYALEQPFAPPPYPYPGRLAAAPEDNASLRSARRWVLELANRAYLARVPAIAHAGRRLMAFSQLQTDFAVVDVHPDDLSHEQRMPHVDPVPVFGLVYLNREERGGTLFFEQKAQAPAPDQLNGYMTESTATFELCGRIEPAFNRLAIYPGFVPHSGEISGEWIKGEERYSNPRLTQRFVFLP